MLRLRKGEDLGQSHSLVEFDAERGSELLATVSCGASIVSAFFVQKKEASHSRVFGFGQSPRKSQRLHLQSLTAVNRLGRGGVAAAKVERLEGFGDGARGVDHGENGAFR